MSESGERSYYEIALTNRQVTTVFLILLTSVAVAFASGLWVGRQAAERSHRGGLMATMTPERPEDDNAYRFFSPGQGETGESREPALRPASGQVAQRPAAPPGSGVGAVAAKPVAAEADQPEPSPGAIPAAAKTPPAPAQPRGETRPTPSTQPPPPTSRPVTDRQEAKPSATVAREAAGGTEEAAPEPRRPLVVDPPPTSELSVIQVFSTPDEAQARAVLDRLLGGGFKAFLSPVQVDQRTMYRVRVGPFSDRALAEAEASKLKSLYKLDTWITN